MGQGIVVGEHSSLGQGWNLDRDFLALIALPDHRLALWASILCLILLNFPEGSGWAAYPAGLAIELDLEDRAVLTRWWQGQSAQVRQGFE